MSGPVLQIAGAIFTMVGMPYIGVPLMMLGAYLSIPDTEGPRLQDRNVQLSSLGAPIPIVFGSWRCQGNIIWPANLTVDEHSTTESSKGGPESTTYFYTASFAVLLCKGPKSGIGRIWANKKLIRDADGNLDPCVQGLREMLGGEDQEPDALMVARDGVAPAYRDSVLLVFEDLELTQSQFGNRPPVIEAEVFSESEITGPPEPSYDGESAHTVPFTQQIAIVDPVTGYIWSLGSDYVSFTNTVEVRVTDDIAQEQIASMSTPFATNYSVDIVKVTATNEIWVGAVGGFATAENFAVIYDATTFAYKDTVTISYHGTGRMQRMEYDPLTDRVLTFHYGGSMGVVHPITRVEEQFISIGIGGPTWIGYDVMTTLPRDFDLAVDVGTVDEYVLIPMYGSYDFIQVRRLDDYSFVRNIMDPYGTLPYNGWTYDPERRRVVFASGSVNGVDLSIVDIETGDITRYNDLLKPDGDASEDGTTYFVQSIAYAAYNDRYIIGTDNEGVGTYSSLLIVNPDDIGIEYAWAYEIYDAGKPWQMVPTMLIPNDDPNYVLVFDLTYIKRYYLGAAALGGPVTLASVVSYLSTTDPHGLSEDDIDVSELTDLVDGYAIGQRMTRRSAIEPLQSSYFFDGVESDHVIKFPKRGQSPVVTIAKADRAAHEVGSEVPADLNITRGSDLELPWRVEINYTDSERDYQVAMQYEGRITGNSNDPRAFDLPLLLTPTHAKSIAMTLLYLAWLTRTTFTFETTNAYAKYEATDVVYLPTDEVTYLARLISRVDEGTGVIKWEAELEDPEVYDQEGIATTSTFVPQTIADIGETVFELLDMPILRDDDDNAGFYVAMGGEGDDWSGAQLFKSVDNGATYDPVLSITNEAAIGVAQGVLGDFDVGNIFDEGNTVTIVLATGDVLVSATETQVLNGTNTAAIGAPGRWEVINFKNATLVGPATYQLSGLLRGRRGTEWAIPTHSAGDVFVLASLATWQRASMSTGELGLTRLYKAPPFRTRLSVAESQSFINIANGLKPYSPVDIAVTLDDDSGLVFTWNRRSRIGYGTLNARVPLGEFNEQYDAEIWSEDGRTRKRTEDGLIAATYTYPADEQTEDFGSPQPPASLVFKVYQISHIFGRGTPGVFEMGDAVDEGGTWVPGGGGGGDTDTDTEGGGGGGTGDPLPSDITGIYVGMGSMAQGSNVLVLSASLGLAVGDWVTHEIGNEGNGNSGRRGDKGVGGTWPSQARAYSSYDAMVAALGTHVAGSNFAWIDNADDPDNTNVFWGRDGNDWLWLGDLNWGAISRTGNYYNAKVVPRSLFAQVQAITPDGLTVTLHNGPTNGIAKQDTTDGRVYFDRTLAIQAIFDVGGTVPAGDHPVAGVLSIPTGTTVYGSGKLTTRIVAPKGVPSLQIIGYSATGSELRDMTVQGNVQDHGFGFNWNDMDITGPAIDGGVDDNSFPQGSGETIGCQFRLSTNCNFRNLRTVDLGTAHMSFAFSGNGWNYDCDMYQTHPHRHYLQWAAAWNDSNGGGAYRLRSFFTHVTCALECFKSQGQSFYDCHLGGGLMSLNGSGDYLFSGCSQTFEDGTFVEVNLINRGAPALSINSAIGTAYQYLGGRVENHTITQNGFAGISSHWSIIATKVWHANPDVVFDNLVTYCPDYEEGAEMMGAQAIDSEGTNFIVTNSTFHGKARWTPENNQGQWKALYIRNANEAACTGNTLVDDPLSTTI